MGLGFLCPLFLMKVSRLAVENRLGNEKRLKCRKTWFLSQYRALSSRCLAGEPMGQWQNLLGAFCGVCGALQGISIWRRKNSFHSVGRRWRKLYRKPLSHPHPALCQSQGFCCSGQCSFSNECLYWGCSAHPVHRFLFTDIHHCTKGKDSLN